MRSGSARVAGCWRLDLEPQGTRSRGQRQVVEHVYHLMLAQAAGPSRGVCRVAPVNLKGRESMLCKQLSAIAQLKMTSGRTAWTGCVQLARTLATGRGRHLERASQKPVPGQPLRSPSMATLFLAGSAMRPIQGGLSSVPSHTKKTLLARCHPTVTASVRKKPVHDRTFTGSLARSVVVGVSSEAGNRMALTEVSRPF